MHPYAGGSDLAVERLSDALAGRIVDVVVSGSIGAVESVRFVRALRRLGAAVTPWLTAGGAQFITPLALSWAAGRDARQTFEGAATHLATGDGCVVAPASANLIAKVAHGFTDSPAAALIASYLGQGKPVLLLPNMHGSLAASPAVRKNLEALAGLGVQLLAARDEEGKRKFPEPAALADEVAHRVNRAAPGGSARGQRVLITMGTTRGYVDDVRYFSNYSSGALGSETAEELYRMGFDTLVVCGPAQVRPRVATRLVPVETNAEMQAAAEQILRQGAQAAVLAASVLDYVPSAKKSGKISSDAPTLSVDLVRTPKIIDGITPQRPVKVGFKLETGLTEARARELTQKYMPPLGLSLMVLNDLSQVSDRRHTAYLCEAAGAALRVVDGKRAVAHAIARHVAERLA